jgi:hypothetical protein
MTDEELQALDRELMHLSLELEALLAAWLDLKRHRQERRDAIEAAVRKATGVSRETDKDYRAQSIADMFMGKVAPDAERYLAVCRRIEERFPEIGDDQWTRVTAPLDRETAQTGGRGSTRS